MPVSDDYVPTPESDYAVPEGMPLGRRQLNGIFGSVAGRLRGVEGRNADYEQAIALLQSQALQAIQATLTDKVDEFDAARATSQAQLDEITDAYEALKAGGVTTDLINMKAPVEGIGGGTLQAVVAAIATKIARQRRITVASLFLGAS